MNISEHITLEEAILSPTALRLGIDNKPNNAQLNNMEKVADFSTSPSKAVIRLSVNDKEASCTMTICPRSMAGCFGLIFSLSSRRWRLTPSLWVLRGGGLF